MDKFRNMRNDLLGEKIVKALEARNMEAYYVATAAEAVRKALELMPEGSQVGWGGSMSIIECGLKDAVYAGNYDILDRDITTDPAERTAIARKIFNSDIFLTSCNAISEDGIMVNIDGIANRISAIAFGPAMVIMIVGMNKAVKSETDAMSRARNEAAPINAQRFGLDTPCAKTGACYDCKTPGNICCQMLITRYSMVPRRIKVILVNEDLGF